MVNRAVLLFGDPLYQGCWKLIDPISTREAHYDHPITTCLPGFSDLATSLCTKKVCAYY